LRIHNLPLLAVVSCVWAIAAQAANIDLKRPPDVPTGLSAQDFDELTQKRNDLLAQLGATQGKIDSQGRDCRAVEEGSPKVADCRASAKQVGAAVRNYRAALDQFVQIRIIKSMNALAKRLGWDASQQARLTRALNSLDVDGAGTSAQARQAWHDVLARESDGDIAREAANGAGPELLGAGKQSFEDCAIFALANATGLPYGVVAARAAKLIREGEWSDPSERANPQRVLEQRGLNGGEVVMLAEAFGQAEVVPGSAFPTTLKGGRSVLVNVVPADGNFQNGHEVVISKAFVHDGATWFEMIDSNQGPQRRLYLSAKELNTIQTENGVAFLPEAGTTPTLLR
jgi:hypothetical protein